ncbi:probable vesicular glutamate transporter eat-4 [Chrysoperla carnea]|uniref:probable vesicular glutamate transporter eat-4 n=1 Tax=Chrysoperla carnea TaxID=189513 RepID=UPI001D07B9D4|nr:probable vesicular glutamate transporter eat-4 [Chrysoperla carnea]
MEQVKFLEYIYGGFPKLDRFSIINKRFTLSFLMFIGFTIMSSGVMLTHGNSCMNSSNGEIDDPFLHLSSFLVGYIIIQLPAAWLSLKFSPLIWFGRTILAHAILLFAVALFGSLGYIFLVVLKFFEGVLAGIVFIVCHAAWKNWTPAAERSTLLTFALAGSYLGDLFGIVMSIFCASLPLWMFVCCIIGIFGIIWWLVWERTVYESPNKHPTISDEEYNQIHPLIQEELRPTEGVSCKQIILSTPFLVLVALNVVRSWNGRFLTYDVEHSIIILIIRLIAFPLSGYLADVLVRKTSLTITNVRKLFVIGVTLMEAVYFFIIMHHSHHNKGTWLHLVSFLMQILYHVAFSAVSVNAVDIAPSHAGVTVAITSVISDIIMSFGFDVDIFLDKIGWTDVINFISIVVHLIVGVIFGIYGTAEPITAKG